MPKNKNYEHDFQQDLNHEIPKIRNITEQNTWTKPNWAIPTSNAKAKNSTIDTSHLKSVEAKKQYEWEKPNWAVAKKSSTNAADAKKSTANGNEQDDNVILKDSIIQSKEQHPVLKTSKQTQAERELEELQRKYEETMRLKEKLLAEQKQKELLQKQEQEHKKQLLAKVKDGVYDNSNNTSMTEEEKNLEKEYAERLKLDELRLTAKQKEDIAWRQKEAERREQERLRREEAKRLASSELAAKHRNDTSWQQN